MATQRRARELGRRARARPGRRPPLLPARHARRLPAYLFTGITLLVALSMALPFCGLVGK